MKTATFLLAISRRAPRRATIPDPLLAAEAFLRKSGDTGEGRALQRLLNAIVLGEGEFNESEIASFSAPTLDLAATLIEARTEGRYSAIEWAQFAI